jgi:hypothetical protein
VISLHDIKVNRVPVFSPSKLPQNTIPWNSRRLAKELSSKFPMQVAILQITRAFVDTVIE